MPPPSLSLHPACTARPAGRSYSIWKVTDLDQSSLSLFLFGAAHDDLWREPEGTIVALFTPKARRWRCSAASALLRSWLSMAHCRRPTLGPLPASTSWSAATASFARPPAGLQVRAEGDFSLSVDSADQVGMHSMVTGWPACIHMYTTLLQQPRQQEMHTAARCPACPELLPARLAGLFCS